MKKFLFPALLVLTLAVAACSTTTAETPTAAAPTETTAPAEPTTTAPTGEITLDANNPCGPYHFIDRVLTTPHAGLPPVTSDDYVLGPMDAPVTFMVYSEPQCPYCAQFDPIIDQIHEMYPNDVRFVFRLRPFPESFHDKSILASQAMVAAGMQGKFQEFRQFIFNHQAKNTSSLPNAADLPDSDFWAQLAPDQLTDWLVARVGDLGIDPVQFEKDMTSEEAVQKVKDAMTAADAIDIKGTPTLLIDGYDWPENSRGTAILSAYVELLKDKNANNLACPDTVIDPTKSYSATLETTQGNVTIDLFADSAPLAVNSFVYLSQIGWYKDLAILPSDQAVITGDPSGTGYGGPGYAFIDEPSEIHTLDETGMVAMFAPEPDRNGSAFFINKAAITGQESRTIFGQVTEGMDVVNALTATDNLISVTINEK